MCGRIAQYRLAEAYFAQLPAHPFAPLEYQRSYNVAPGTHPLYIHSTDDGYAGATARWGYQHGAKRMYINARLETAAKSGYWRPLWEHGRILVPADGWFEWTGAKGDRQPHYIYRQDRAPMMLAGLLGADGFVIVTTSADRGLLDVHDRRPVALSSEGAARWVSAGTSPKGALEVAAEESLPEDAFSWHEVTRAMGNSRYQGEDAIEPIDTTPTEQLPT